MATRQETARRREALAAHLHRITADGTVRPGERLPSLRELSARFELSMPVVARELQPFVDAGTIRTIRGQGLVLATIDRTDRTYVFVTDSGRAARAVDQERMRFGFERAAASRGGSCLVVGQDQLARLLSDSSDRIAGVFSWSRLSDALAVWVSDHEIPTVVSCYLDGPRLTGPHDRIGHDDLDGGRQAAMHLVRRGHRRIGFVGFHRDGDIGTARRWSRDRQRGWAEVLEGSEAGPGPTFLVPPEDGTPRTARESAQAVARLVVPRITELDGLVAADDIVLMGLVEELTAGGVDRTCWPAMVSFEGFPEAEQYVCTAVCPDRELLGAEAAALLDDRATGRSDGPPGERRVPMTVLTRLSSQPRWATDERTRGIFSRVA